MSFFRGLFGSREVNELERDRNVKGLISILDDKKAFSFKRVCAAEALRRLESRDALPSVIAALADDDVSVAAAAAAVLEKVPERSALPALVRLLDRDEDLVVLHASRALGALGDKGALEPLLNALGKHEDDPDVMSSIIDALGRFKDGRAVDPIVNALKTSKYSVVRERAVRALGAIGDPKAVDALIAKLKDYDYFYIRKTAAYTLYVFYRQDDLDPAIRQKILTHWRSWYLT